ncbi:MAG: phage tail protein [Candidatus Ventricola sp.]|nr:phage tail protein [Candidatus Ventricola sp.]
MTRLARVLDSDMRELRRLHPTQQSIDDRVTPLSTASLTLPEGEHAAFGEWVEVFTQNGSAGIYRVVSASETYTGEASAELEHGICALGDAIIPGEGTISGTLSHVLSAMLGYQVVQAGGTPLWALGSVATNAQASFEHDGTNLLSAVLAVVPNGYMLTFDQSALPWRIGVAAMETAPSCEGRLTRNLRSVTVTTDEEDFCTRIYCDKLPDPGYMDGPTVGTWGIVAKTITAQDNVTQKSLIAYITQYLEDHKNPRVSIECDAEDLSSITGERIDRMEKGRLFRLALPDYGVAMEERILSVHTGSAYDEPERVRLTLANSIRDTADTLVYIENSVNGGASSSSARGGYVRGIGGSGISQASVLDMLKKAETYITEDEAWTREAGIRIESNYAEIYATKKAIVGGWTGDVETIDALIKASTDNGGLVAMMVGRKNSAEEINALISATAAGGGLIMLKASQKDVDALSTRVSQAEIDIDGANAQIALKASQTTVDALGKRVSSAEINIDGAKAAIELKVSKDGIISSINQTPESITISASKINLSGYVTASQLSAEFASFESSIANSLYVSALSSSSFECSTFSFKGSGMSLASKTFVTSASGSATGSIAVRDASGTIIGTALTGYKVTYSTDTIYYMSWE